MGEQIIPDEDEAEAHYTRIWELVTNKNAPKWAALRADKAKAQAEYQRAHASPYANVFKPSYVEATSHD